MKFLAIWYNMETAVKEEIIEASSMEEAESKAYLKYDGNTPAPMLSLSKIEE